MDMEGVERYDAEEMREILRLEFEHASHIAKEAGNSAEMARFSQLADTVREIEPSLLEAYSELFDGLTDVEVSSEMFRRIGLSWFPITATEFVTKFISVRTGGHF
jgi:hypothetical protein